MRNDKAICETVCYGCGACAKVCPVQAVEMKENQKGFLNPVIDENKCVNCNKCVEVCRRKSDFHIFNDTYIAKLKDEDSMLQSQSGGAFIAIANSVLERGGVVYGAVINEQFEAEHIRATNRSEVDKMRGSKYVQSNLKDVYCQVERDLTDNVVLFSGTPCQVAGLNKYLNYRNSNTDNLYTVDLVCHGVPSVRLWRDLIRYYEEKYKDKVTKVVFCDKYRGLGRPHFNFCIKKKLISDGYHRQLFYTNLALRESCYVCEYAKSERVSDFTIADAWGVKENNPEFFDSGGVSLFIMHTDKAVTLFPEIERQMYMKSVLFDDYRQGNMKSPSAPHRSIEQFWKDYEERTFRFIIEKYAKNNIFLNLKYAFKVLWRKLSSK
jgi:coenzyme F420-reducing hydrogenase beta subunit